LRVDLVPVEQVKFIWPLVRDYIKTATETAGDCEIDVIEASVLCGNLALWVIHNGLIFGAAVTELRANKTTKWCEVTACGGKEMHRWRGLLETVEQYAKAEGCSKVRISGRRGWARVYPDYSEAWVTIEKSI
jgi:hypothetical protein